MNRFAVAFLLLTVVAAVPVLANDNVIYDAVRQKLVNDPDVKGYRLTVTVKDGVVTLEGRVTSVKFREKAEKIVKKVNGVKQVINRLEVGEDRPR